MWKDGAVTGHIQEGPLLPHAPACRLVPGSLALGQGTALWGRWLWLLSSSPNRKVPRGRLAGTPEVDWAQPLLWAATAAGTGRTTAEERVGPRAPLPTP